MAGLLWQNLLEALNEAVPIVCDGSLATQSPRHTPLAPALFAAGARELTQHIKVLGGQKLWAAAVAHLVGARRPPPLKPGVPFRGPRPRGCEAVVWTRGDGGPFLNSFSGWWGWGFASRLESRMRYGH